MDNRLTRAMCNGRRGPLLDTIGNKPGYYGREVHHHVHCCVILCNTINDYLSVQFKLINCVVHTVQIGLPKDCLRIARNTTTFELMHNSTGGLH